MGRIFAVIVGLILLLPGLCTLVFGVNFLSSSYTRAMAPLWFIVGGGVTAAGIAVLVAASRR